MLSKNRSGMNSSYHTGDDVQDNPWIAYTVNSSSPKVVYQSHHIQIPGHKLLGNWHRWFEFVGDALVAVFGLPLVRSDVT